MKEKMKKAVFLPIIVGLVLFQSGCRFDAGTSGKNMETRSVMNHSDNRENIKVKMATNGEVIHATLVDNAATRDFVAMLPLTLTLEDYNKTEKIAGLPQRLSTAGASEGYTPHKGDIAFYAPWGNLCIFYRDFRYSPGLVKLGKIDGDGVSKLAETDSVTIGIDVRK